MNFFKTLGNIFSNQGREEELTSSESGWNRVSSEKEVDEIILSSNHKTQVLYKHSTRCATSFFALQNLKSISEEKIKKTDFYLIDVIGQRNIAGYISQQLHVRHESPQVLILRDGKVVWHGSHHMVQTDNVVRYL
ncbi:bacillithiol system redox-active protein YtxJ [Gracilimonas sp.]|uniref:bacillithiol system redox-active protein YtxJ n=1 Tax=Gracilimonas sp. TaxID=1974203 RepID=UPI002871DA19|nr:bacillithiol system redox-active protein YtxJ [Gracilimonas sp.]